MNQVTISLEEYLNMKQRLEELENRFDEKVTFKYHEMHELRENEYIRNIKNLEFQRDKYKDKISEIKNIFKLPMRKAYIYKEIEKSLRYFS